MTWLSVDSRLCTRCGACVEVCPLGLLTLGASLDGPQPVGQAEAACIDCGHCVAVCPPAALALATQAPADCVPLPKDWLPPYQGVEQLLRGRRSVRCYQQHAVPREQLAELLDVARQAPSGSNRQPVGWLVLYDQALVQRTAEEVIAWMRQGLAQRLPGPGNMLGRIVGLWERGVDSICRGAPHLVIAHVPAGAGAVDATIALTYLDLAATARGLGACWDGFVSGAARHWPALPALWGLPEGRECAGALLLGYPRHRYPRVPRRKELEVIWR
jgi:nitroreductase/NAD-dependent dihydropyrimidine dehydrogenase PreA subunit